MSKYNLSDILNEFICGCRIGTLKISFKDLQDKMDDLENSGKVIVRTLPGPSGDGKVNREFEVVDRDSAVPGGNKQERGFTVYDYKFGFDPGDEDNFMNEYPFSVGGNDLKLAMELIDGVEEYKFEESMNEENVIKDLAQADEVIKMIKMMNPDVRADLLMRIARMGQKMDENINEGDLFSSKFDRRELKDIINDLNKGLILDMPTRRAYKFLVSLLDNEDKKELGLNESTGPSDKAETEDDVVNIDKVAGPSAKGVGYGAETSANTAEDDMEDKEVANPRPMYENGDTSDFTSELKEESSKKVKIRAYLKDYYTNPKDPKDVRIDDKLIDEFFEFTDDNSINIENMDMDDIVGEYDEFIFLNKDVMEDVRKQFKRFM